MALSSSFTDFLVYEIGLDGEPIRLKSLDGPTQAKTVAPVPAADGPKPVSRHPPSRETCVVCT